jgi:hypothetical protein
MVVKEEDVLHQLMSLNCLFFVTVLSDLIYFSSSFISRYFA